MRIAITGASGYLGRNLVDFFNQNGHEVICLSRKNIWSAESKVDFLPFQLGQPMESFPKQIDVLIHAAYDLKARKWSEIEGANILGSEILFNQAKKEGVKRIINISSISAFEGCKSNYGKAKLQVEKIAAGFNAISIRPGLIHGGDFGGMYQQLKNTVEKGGIVPVLDGKNLFQYLISIDTLNQQIQHLASSDKTGVITMANPEGILLHELLKSFQSSKKVHFIKVPWRFVWLAIKVFETVDLKLDFRSDSVLSLAHQNPNPDFSYMSGISESND